MLIDDLPWTIARYLKLMQNTPAQLKLGVGYYYKVSVYFIVIQYNSFKCFQSQQCSSLPGSKCGSSSLLRTERSLTSVSQTVEQASSSSVVFPPGS